MDAWGKSSDLWEPARPGAQPARLRFASVSGWRKPLGGVC